MRLRAHGGKQEHVADGRRVGEQHHQPVDADAESAGRWHAHLDRLEKVLVDRRNLGVPGGAQPRLFFESRALVDRIIELAERVGKLAPRDDQLESLDETRIVAPAPRQRAHLGRVVEHEGWIPELTFDALFVDLEQHRARTEIG